ncbi:MAG: rhodanese-like domain-containing protein [Salinivirgaceae bacterium]
MEDLLKDKGISIKGQVHLSPKEAYELSQQGAVFVDVREEFMSHIKTFDVTKIYIAPLRTFKEGLEQLPKDKLLIFVDATGIKSKYALEYASEKGLTAIANLAGGLVAWERQGLPTITYQRMRVAGHSRCEFVHKDHIGQ